MDISQFLLTSDTVDSNNLEEEELQEPLSSDFCDEEISQRKRKTANQKSKALNENFEGFMKEIKFASYNRKDDLFEEILGSLIVKCPGIHDEVHLARTFDSLMRKLSHNPRYGKINWSEEETHFLISIIAYHCLIHGSNFHAMSDKDWESLGKFFPTKQATQLNRRWNTIVRTTVAQKPWTPLEDKLLANLVAEYGSERQWKTIAEKINAQSLSRCYRLSRQCRERWNNYVDPKIIRGGWTREDDAKLMDAFQKMGKKWSAIAKLLGRTENAVRNRWNSLVKKSPSYVLEKNASNGNSEAGFATNYLEKVNTQGYYESSEETSQATDYNHASYQMDNTGRKGVDMVGGPLYQAESVFKEEANASNTVYLKPVLDWNQNTNELNQESYQGFGMASLPEFQSFKFSSGPKAEQKFSQEVSKSDSQVFYAMIDPTTKEMKLMEKVSQDNWPRYMWC